MRRVHDIEGGAGYDDDDDNNNDDLLMTTETAGTSRSTRASVMASQSTTTHGDRPTAATSPLVPDKERRGPRTLTRRRRRRGPRQALAPPSPRSTMSWTTRRRRHRGLCSCRRCSWAAEQILTSETSKRLRGRSDRRGLQLSVRCSATTAPQALQSLDSKSSSSSEAMENSGFRGREHKSGCRRCPNHAPSLRSHLDRHNKAAAVPRTKGVTNVVMAAAASMVQKHKTTAHVPVLHCHGIGEACWGGV